jgi:hypothetical protein
MADAAPAERLKAVATRIPAGAPGAGQFTCIPHDDAWLARHKAKRAASNAVWNQRARNACLNHYGRVCACCGETDMRFLTLDHVNGDGNAQRKTHTSLNLVQVLVKQVRETGIWPNDLQTLCYNCNMAKRTGPVCPHKRPVPDEPDAIVLFTIEEVLELCHG